MLNETPNFVLRSKINFNIIVSTKVLMQIMLNQEYKNKIINKKIHKIVMQFELTTILILSDEK